MGDVKTAVSVRNRAQQGNHLTYVRWRILDVADDFVGVARVIPQRRLPQRSAAAHQTEGDEYQDQFPHSHFSPSCPLAEKKNRVSPRSALV